MTEPSSSADFPTPRPEDLHKRLSLPLRCLLMVFAVLCVILGLIGAVVPGMPTTVFILMAAWAAVRSSPRLHGWLYAHSLFGPMLRNWDDGGQVSRRVKWMASASMVLSSALIFHVAENPWLSASAVAVMASVQIWLWLRPEPQA